MGIRWNGVENGGRRREKEGEEGSTLKGKPPQAAP